MCVAPSTVHRRYRVWHAEEGLSLLHSGASLLSRKSALHAFLISDGSREGSHELAQRLARLFELELIAPVFLSADQAFDGNIVNRRSFLAKHLREPSMGEIGCALAHRSAQARLLELGLQSAAIFEDDARIGDTDHFAKRINTYESVCHRRDPTLINLNRDAVPRRVERKSRAFSGLARTFTPPYPATAYAINRAAAHAFVKVQSPISAQADWPRTRENITFLVDRQSSIFEDKSIASRIDDHGYRVQIPWSVKARMWSGLWFFEHRHEFPSFSQYVNWLPKARLIYHCDRLQSPRD